MCKYVRSRGGGEVGEVLANLGHQLIQAGRRLGLGAPVGRLGRQVEQLAEHLAAQLQRQLLHLLATHQQAPPLARNVKVGLVLQTGLLRFN